MGFVNYSHLILLISSLTFEITVALKIIKDLNKTLTKKTWQDIMVKKKYSGTPHHFHRYKKVLAGSSWPKLF